MSEELKLSAANFGFDANWIADVLQKFGPDVLAVAVEAARNGFSVSLVVEILQKFGPQVLDFLVSLLSKKSMAMAEVIPGTVVTGDKVFSVDPNFIDVIISKYLPELLNTVLPQIMAQFGPQILQLITNLITQYLQQNLPKS
jgi:hypothetical protein